MGSYGANTQEWRAVAYVDKIRRDSVPQTEHHNQSILALVQEQLVAEHLPGVLNTIADEESHVMKDQSDWMLNIQQ